MRWVFGATLVVSLALSGCGAAGTGAGSTRTTAFEAADFLREVGAASSSVLRAPERSIEELEAARRQARGAERRQVTRELAIASMFAAERADDREARRLRRRAEEMADAATSGSRDARLTGEMEFAKLWMSWRAGARNAAQRATRFTERHRDAGMLHTIAWMIRAEIAFTAERFDDAVTAFRFTLGQLEHPLYAYALFRTAHAYRRLGRSEDADQALSEVEQLGCARTASPFVMRVASAAASERGSGLRLDTDGVMRPAACAAPGERSGDEPWRPRE